MVVSETETAAATEMIGKKPTESPTKPSKKAKVKADFAPIDQKNMQRDIINGESRESDEEHAQGIFEKEYELDYDYDPMRKRSEKMQVRQKLLALKRE